MRVWIVSFAVLFGLAELYLWIKDFIYPLPLYVLGGAILAIASNYEKGIFSGFEVETRNFEDDKVKRLIDERIKALESKESNLPALTPNCQPSSSISLTTPREESIEDRE